MPTYEYPRDEEDDEYVPMSGGETTGSLLTKGQRKYLLDTSDITPGSSNERSTRANIRKRLRAGLWDFRTLVAGLDTRDRRRAFLTDATDEDSLKSHPTEVTTNTHEPLMAALGFLYLIVADNPSYGVQKREIRKGGINDEPLALRKRLTEDAAIPFAKFAEEGIKSAIVRQQKIAVNKVSVSVEVDCGESFAQHSVSGENDPDGKREYHTDDLVELSQQVLMQMKLAGEIGDEQYTEAFREKRSVEKNPTRRVPNEGPEVIRTNDLFLRKERSREIVSVEPHSTTDTIGDTAKAWMDVPWELGQVFFNEIDENAGLRWLDGKSGRDCARKIKSVFGDLKDQRGSKYPESHLQTLSTIREWADENRQAEFEVKQLSAYDVDDLPDGFSGDLKETLGGACSGPATRRLWISGHLLRFNWPSGGENEVEMTCERCGESATAPDTAEGKEAALDEFAGGVCLTIGPD